MVHKYTHLDQYINISKPFVLFEKEERVFIFQGILRDLKSTDDVLDLSNRYDSDVIFFLPFRTLQEKNFVTKGNEPILSMIVQYECSMPKSEIYDTLPDHPIHIEDNLKPTIDDLTFQKMIEDVQECEINKGQIAQITLSRLFTTRLLNCSMGTILSLYKRLLDQKGHHRTILFADPVKNQFLIGMTPKRHLQIAFNETIMSPLSGTFIKRDESKFEDDVTHFLQSSHAMQKLYQQMDEELKLMVRFCSEGGRIMGPYLREMDEVIHSEYDIIGSRAKDSFEALKISGHSPCIIGSPVKKACALIHQYESESRRYYGGGVGIYRHNPRGTADGDLDVSVIIRMAEISQSGRLDYRVGTNIMVHSNPETEMRSTIRKTEGFLKILKGQSDTKKEWLTPERRKIIEPLLQNCNDRMSPFWRTPQNSWFRGERFDHLTIQIIDGGNDFSWMLLHMLNHMGAKAEIIELDHFTPPQIAPDLVILGSGPGFIKSDTLQDKYKPVLNYLMHHEIPVLGIGLGHQLLCDYYGFDIAHTNDNTNHLSSQGTQRQIMIFDRPHYAGFYNSFAMIYDHKTAEKQGIYCETDEFNHIMTLRSHHHIGFQFHPESVMSETGYGLLNQAISLLTTKWL